MIKFHSHLKNIKKGDKVILLRFFYPPKCLLCRHLLPLDSKEPICSLCDTRLKEHIEALRQLYHLSIEPICLDSELSTLPVLYLTPYDSYSRYAIQRWKYKGNRCYATKFAKLLTQYYNFLQYESPLFVPIPISPNRLIERGFNHAYDLATELSKITHIPVCHCLKRTRNTKKQSTLHSIKERESNLKASMTLLKSQLKSITFPVQTILLIDDIFTTGSTMREALRILAQEQAFKDAKILCVTVSKAKL